MKAINPSVRVCVLSVVVLLAVGCMPSAPDGKVGTADEYVYKGRPDPLLSESGANRQAKLSERFKLIQARQ